MSQAQQLGLILLGVVSLAILAAFGVYWYENIRDQERKKFASQNPPSQRVKQWRNQLGADFDPRDPNDPVAAIIAAGEYFRMPGCEPGGPHYEETLKRVLDMVEGMVQKDRVSFWHDQVYRLYGSAKFPRRPPEKA